MDRKEFISIVPMIKVWETKLLNKSFYSKMINSNSLEEAINALQETPYGEGINGGNFEARLDDSFKNLCDDLYKAIKSNEIIEFVRLKNDYHNLKTLIKAKVLDKDFSYILNKNGTMPIDKIEQAIKNDDYRDVSANIENAIKEVFLELDTKKDSQVIDIVVDRYMFKDMVSIAKKIESAYISKYVKTVIDLTNIKTVLRLKKINKDKSFLSYVFIEDGTVSLDMCKNMLSDDFDNIPNRLAVTPYETVIREVIDNYSESKSLSSLEKRFDDYIMAYVRDAKFINFGVEPVFAYLYAREIEIKNLRIILAGKINKVDSEIINERLRDNYV